MTTLQLLHGSVDAGLSPQPGNTYIVYRPVNTANPEPRFRHDQ
jgi:hypothetical protein